MGLFNKSLLNIGLIAFNNFHLCLVMGRDEKVNLTLTVDHPDVFLVDVDHPDVFNWSSLTRLSFSTR